VFIDVAVLGEAPGGRYLPRSGASAGDVLVVTGWPGRSAAALGAFMRDGAGAVLPDALRTAHLRPVARLEEGRWLAGHAGVHAMADVSDGIVQDTRHIAERSNAGIAIDASVQLEDLLLLDVCAAHGLDARQCYWAGGEDYELVAAINAAAFEVIAQEFERRFQLPLKKIGVFSGTAGEVRVTGWEPAREGFDHFRNGK
jgi:thiamine-monophosphate kinase